MDNPTISDSRTRSVLSKGYHACCLVTRDLAAFEAVVCEEIARYPHFRRFFSHLVSARLRQTNVLSSPLLASVFNGISAIEGRLAQIQTVEGIGQLPIEYQPARDSDKGSRTDEAALDCLAEVLVLFFLTIKGATEITKVVSDPNTPHIDIRARMQSRQHAIEITRKKEVTEWMTLAFESLTDCTSGENQRNMRDVISRILAFKSDQFSRCLTAGSLPADDIRVIAIKLSDFGFQDCIEEACLLTRSLLSRGQFDIIEVVWLIPDVEVEDSCWIDRAAG